MEAIFIIKNTFPIDFLKFDILNAPIEEEPFSFVGFIGLGDSLMIPACFIPCYIYNKDTGNFGVPVKSDFPGKLRWTGCIVLCVSKSFLFVRDIYY